MLTEHENAFSALRTAQDRALEVRLEAQHAVAVAELEERLRREMVDASDAARRHIIDSILTRHCPACDAAFDDWDACAAVKCRNCPCHFCGICLANCGTAQVAHRHCATCVWTGRELYLREDQVAQKTNEWRREQIQRALACLPAGARKQLLQSIAVQLRHVGLGDLLA